jgi:nitrogen fixation/metabolism regulation signal transduction histidine kinase
MKLRRKFLVFAILIHSIFMILSILLLSENKYFFLVAELLILTSLLISIQLYRGFLKPLNLLSAGIESIKDRDFNTTFIETGQEELDRLISVYNSMIDQLRSERVRQKEQHYFLERLVKASPVGVIILDLDENIAVINRAAQTMLGVNSEDILGEPLHTIRDGPGAELAGLKAGESTTVGTSGVQTLKCRKSQFVDRGFYRHFILIEELTKEILVAQKKAYEKVIRMMSHEINNSVGAVNSILQSSLYYKDQLTPDDRPDFESAIQVAIDRNCGLNRFMSNLADVVRVPVPVKEAYDLHELLRTVQVLMSAECDKNRIDCHRGNRNGRDHYR